MAKAPTTEAQRQAQIQAQQLVRDVREHRSALQSISNMRSGVCTADGWIITQDVMNGDFDLDSSLVQALFSDHAAGPAMRSMPTTAPSPVGSSVLERYFYPPPPTAAAGTSARVLEEVPGVMYGAGNVAGNVSAAVAGALQGLGERTGRRVFADGVAAIMRRQVQRVRLAPNVELYNSAQPKQQPRVRLRVRGLPMTRVQAAVPTVGGPATHWRMNGPGTTASLRVQGMGAQQMRNTAILAAENRMPWVLRASTGRVGGGVLAFGPSAVIDAIGAIEQDTAGRRSFNGQKFLIDSAKSQSGNAVGFAGGMLVGAVAVSAGVVGAPVILIALVGGLVFQLAWSSFGGSELAENLAKDAIAGR